MFLDHKIDPMNRSLRYWRVAAIPGVMIPVDVHILLAWNHQFSERFDEGKADRTRLWLQGEEAQKDATMGYWAIFGIWLLTAALVFEFFGSVSQLKENGRCVYYLYISIHNYTILYYIYIIYILYSTWGPSEVDSFAWQLPRFELPSTTRWMRSILTSASLAKERLRSSGSARSARREANRISGRKDAPSSGAERFGGFGLNIEVFQHKLAIFLGIPGPQSHW